MGFVVRDGWFISRLATLVAGGRAMETPKIGERVPGNFYFFKMQIEIRVNGTSWVGCPKMAIRDTGRVPPVVRWGSPPELAWPNPAVPRAQWVDDAKNGVSARTITCPEDVLGSEGEVGGKRYCFEQILEVGQNQVVFSLLCSNDNIRMAYGFARDMFTNKREATSSGSGSEG
jgi:hypothetical protein